VAQESLDVTEVGPVLQKVHCEAVPQEVGVPPGVRKVFAGSPLRAGRTGVRNLVVLQGRWAC